MHQDPNWGAGKRRRRLSRLQSLRPGQRKGEGCRSINVRSPQLSPSSTAFDPTIAGAIQFGQNQATRHSLRDLADFEQVSIWVAKETANFSAAVRLAGRREENRATRLQDFVAFGAIFDANRERVADVIGSVGSGKCDCRLVRRRSASQYQQNPTTQKLQDRGCT